MATSTAPMPWLDELSEDWGTEEIPEEPPADADNSPHLPLTSSNLQKNGKVNRLDLSGANKVNDEKDKENILASPGDNVGDNDDDDEAGSLDGSVVHNSDASIAVRLRNGKMSKEEQEIYLPEWKLRLMNQENPVNDGGDLFGPTGLEKLFVPPPPKSKPQAPVNTAPNNKENPARPTSIKAKPLSINVSKAEGKGTSSRAQQHRPSANQSSLVDNSVLRTQSASFFEDQRNEYMSPVSPSFPRITRAGTSPLSISNQDFHADKEPVDSIDVTTHSLPADLPMGTPDVNSTLAFQSRKSSLQLDSVSKGHSSFQPGPVPTSPLSPSIVSNPKLRHGSHAESEAQSPDTRSSSPRQPSFRSRGHRLRSPKEFFTRFARGGLDNLEKLDIDSLESSIRQRSITTGDYLNEATKVVDLLRARAMKAAQPSLDSVAEDEPNSGDESKANDADDEVTPAQSTSRPGTGGGNKSDNNNNKKEPPSHKKSRLPQLNNSNLRRLQQYAEKGSGTGNGKGPPTFPQSINIPSPTKDSSRGESPEFKQRAGLHGSPQKSRPHTARNASLDSGDGNRSNGSRVSSKSTAIASEASHGSNVSKGVISSNRVAHLIPESVGPMVYDRSKKAWVKGGATSRNGSDASLASNASNRAQPPPAVSEEFIRGEQTSSEDDPFKDIPDLTVNESEEVRLIAAGHIDIGPRQRAQSEYTPRLDGLKASVNADRPSSAAVGGAHAPKPTGLDRNNLLFGLGISNGAQSSTRSDSIHTKSTMTQASQRQDTRDTTWESEHPSPLTSSMTPKGNTPMKVRNQSPLKASNRQEPSPGAQDSSRPVTIMFSSPVVPQVQYHPDGRPFTHEGSMMAGVDHSHAQGQHPPFFERRNFRGQPIPRIEEEATDTSFEEEPQPTDGRGDQNALGFSMIPFTFIPSPDKASGSDNPAHVRQDITPSKNLRIPPSNTKLDSSYSFQLNPLSDFTVHQQDAASSPQNNSIVVRSQKVNREFKTDKREVSFAGSRLHPSSLRQMHGPFALAAEELVRHITDSVQLKETCWDRLRHLDISGRGLTSVVKLSHFCPKLEELTLNDNRLNQLDGIPTSVRNLRVRNNCLGELTAWSFLQNLQYVDVSGNGLESLDALSKLVHLRGLKADNNRINRLDGVLNLDGLLTLSVRDNRLTDLDFGRAAMARLMALDVKGNQIKRIKELHRLSSLEELDLSDNALESFQLATPRQRLQRLDVLRISNNKLTDLNLSFYPNLKLLCADGNCLATLDSLYRCPRLETLSLREQNLDFDDENFEESDHVTLDIDISFLPALRKFVVSSNYLAPRVIQPKEPVPSLQHLDVASCGLQSLPDVFGSRFPNLRVLNANFNALRALTALRDVTRMTRISLAGNRLSSLREVCRALRDAGGRAGFLKSVDLRGNPLTIGFYPALSAAALAAEKRKQAESTSKEDDSSSRHHANLLKDHMDSENETTSSEKLDDPVTPDTTLEIEGRALHHDSPQRRRSKDDHSEADDPYTLPRADADADSKYFRRLDEDTRMRRRVVHCVLDASANGGLNMLDGLDFTASANGHSGTRVKGLIQNGPGGKVGGSGKDEAIFNRLVELGVMKKKTTRTPATATTAAAENEDAPRR